MGRNDGFTYIGLIIVIFIMGIISVMSARSYLEYNARKVTESETLKVIEYIELARSKTQAGERPSSCPSFTGSYGVTASGSVLSVVPEGCTALTTATMDTVSFPGGNFSLWFKPIDGGITGSTCIRTQHPTANYCGKIEIEPSGAVEYSLVNLTDCICP